MEQKALKKKTIGKIGLLLISILALAVVGVIFYKKLLPDKTRIDKEAVEHVVRQQMQAYPASLLQDIYKNFFQDYWGPEHMISDSVAVANYLQQELASFDDCYPCSGADIEATGLKGNFYRVNLCVIKKEIIPFDVFLNAFIESANQTTPPPLSDWIDTWNEIVKTIDAMQLDLPNYEADKANISNILQSGQYAIHHSEQYTRQYEPHYRIIKKEIYEALIR